MNAIFGDKQMNEQYFVIGALANGKRTELSNVEDACVHALKLLAKRQAPNDEALYVVKVVRVIRPTMNAMIEDAETGNRHFVAVG